MATMLSRDELHAAVKSGDIATLDAYFAQSDVRAHVDSMEAFISSNGDGLSLYYARKLDPWYVLPVVNGYHWVRTSVLDSAVENGQYEVLQWFLSPVREVYMGLTVSNLLVEAVVKAAKADQLEILELVLTSKAWDSLSSKKSRWTLDCMDRMIQYFHASSRHDYLQVLLAHGADVNANLLELACNGSITKKQVDLLAHEGVFWVGSNLLAARSYRTRRVSFGKNLDGVRQLLHVGVDVGRTAGEPLHRAAKEGDHAMVKLLLEEGCLDFDAYNKGQQTALMMVVLGLERSHDRKGLPIVTRLLLDAGADATREDCQGRTALRHAKLQKYFGDIVEILQQHEANPAKKK